MDTLRESHANQSRILLDTAGPFIAHIQRSKLGEPVIDDLVQMWQGSREISQDAQHPSQMIVDRQDHNHVSEWPLCHSHKNICIFMHVVIHDYI